MLKKEISSQTVNGVEGVSIVVITEVKDDTKLTLVNETEADYMVGVSMTADAANYTYTAITHSYNSQVHYLL